VLSLVKKIAYLYPLSFLGTLVSVAGLWLLIVFIRTSNPLSLVFSTGFIVVVLAAVVSGRVHAERMRTAVLEWDSSEPLVAQKDDAVQYVNLEGRSMFPLFNLHFRLAGRLKVGHKAWIRVREEQAVIKKKDNRVPLYFYFPLSGVLSAKGSFLFRDILGLTRTNFGREDVRELAVLPAATGQRKINEIISSQGYEESVKKRSQEEERYFMREYMPGDRLRDINWKATARLSQLITKIAPVTQEQTRTIAVFFRNIKPDSASGLEAVVHLHRCKSLLLTFLRHVKRSSPDYVFQVVTAQDKFLLESEEDIERFGKSLTAWEYCPAPSVGEYDRSIGEIYVFSTQYDRDLVSFLGLFEHARVTAVQTVSVGKRDRTPHARFRLLVPFTPSLVPGRFAWRRDRPVRTGSPGQSKNVVYERDPIEIGLW
jgi:hypothetical protein